MDHAQALFEQLRTGGAAYVESLASAKTLESLILDFKEKTKPSGAARMGEDDKNNYARALSGFANAMGGVLVWGVGEASDGQGERFANAPAPISELSSFIQQLNSLLPDAVHRSVDGVLNIPIPIQGETDKGYALTYVPESERAPHRAEFRLKNYYRRVGSSFIPMEHYEIEDMFGRRQRPRLTVKLDSKAEHLTGELHLYRLVVEIANEGRSMARWYGVDVEMPWEAVNHKTINLVFGTSDLIWSRVHPTDGDLVLMTHRNRDTSPLFPGELNRYAIGFVVTDKISEAHDSRELKVTVYADNAPPTVTTFMFGEIHTF